MSNPTRRHQIHSLKLSLLCSAQNFARSKTTLQTFTLYLMVIVALLPIKCNFLSKIKYSKRVPAMHAFLVLKHIIAV